MVGSEHHAEGRDDGVEAGVVERQRFGVGLLEADLQALGGGALGATLEQRTDVVGRGDEAARRAAARVALPLPAATSRTRSSVRRSQASASDSPTICKVVPMTA
jgi:hypothetical protein